MPTPDTFVPNTSWQQLSSGGVQVSTVVTVPTASYFSPLGGQDGLIGSADGILVFLRGTTAPLDGGQKWLLWEALSSTAADGVNVFNPHATPGLLGRWVTAATPPVASPTSNGVVRYGGSEFVADGSFTWDGAVGEMDGRLIINSNTAHQVVNLGFTFPLQVQGADAASLPIIASLAFGTNAGIVSVRANGTRAAPTSISTGDLLAVYGSGGYGATTYKLGTGGLAVRGGENWNDAHQGSVVTLDTIAPGATIPALPRMIVGRGIQICDAAGNSPGGGDPGEGKVNAASGFLINGGMGALVTNSPANPAGTTSLTGVMMGLGGVLKFTPRTTGVVEITINGTALTSVNGDGYKAEIHYARTSVVAVPANGAVPVGSLAGKSAYGQLLAVAASGADFTRTAIISGLTLNVEHWTDLLLMAVTGGTASMIDLNVIIKEITL